MTIIYLINHSTSKLFNYVWIMGYKSFEDLEVYKAAREIRKKVKGKRLKVRRWEKMEGEKLGRWAKDGRAERIILNFKFKTINKPNQLITQSTYNPQHTTCSTQHITHNVQSAADLAGIKFLLPLFHWVPHNQPNQLTQLNQPFN